MPDARAIADEIKLSIGESVHDPTDPVGRLLFNALAMIAELRALVPRRPMSSPTRGERAAEPGP